MKYGIPGSAIDGRCRNGEGCWIGWRSVASGEDEPPQLEQQDDKQGHHGCTPANTMNLPCWWGRKRRSVLQHYSTFYRFLGGSLDFVLPGSDSLLHIGCAFSSPLFLPNWFPKSYSIFSGSPASQFLEFVFVIIPKKINFFKAKNRKKKSLILNLIFYYCFTKFNV